MILYLVSGEFFGLRFSGRLSTILIRFFLLDISAPLVVITADPDLGLQVSSTQTFESNCDLLKSVTCFSGVYPLCFSEFVSSENSIHATLPAFKKHFRLKEMFYFLF